MNYEDITTKYCAKTPIDLKTIKNDGHQLFVAELVKTPDGRILIPEMGRQDANLFAVFGATDELTLVAEFVTISEAEKFLEDAKSDGWDVWPGHDILPGIRWLAQVRPRATYHDFLWLRDEFSEWLPAEFMAAA